MLKEKVRANANNDVLFLILSPESPARDTDFMQGLRALSALPLYSLILGKLKQSSRNST